MMKTTLVVEDSGTSRDLTVYFLQQGGFRALESEGGELRKRRKSFVQKW